MKFVSIKDALPQMGYEKPEIKDERCGSCVHVEVTNAGANIPGFHCQLARRLFKEAGIEHGSSCVDQRYGICEYYKYWRDAEAEEAAAKATAENL